MSDYESAQRRRNMIVGIFVLAGLCALVWLIFKFGDLPIVVGELKSFEVKVQFPTAQGVMQNTPVRFCGYQIGRVTHVEPPRVLKDLNTGKLYHQTMVVLSIDRRYTDIPADVKVKLMTRGLGSSYIEFEVTVPDANAPAVEVLADASILQGSAGMTSEFFPQESQQKLDELVDSLKGGLDDLRDIIGDPNTKANLRQIVANLSDATGRLTEALETFKEFSAAGTQVLHKADANMGRVVATAVGATEDLSKTLADLRVLMGKVSDGEGTIGRLVNDGQLYENLLENTEQLQLLLKNMQELSQKLTQVAEKLRKKGISLF